jgi:hypothetical protein
VNLNKVPSVLVLIAIWAVLRLAGVDVALPSIGGLILIALSVASLIFEFYKSGDIGFGAFKRDLAFSLAATIAGSVVMTVLVLRTEYGLEHLLVDGLVVIVILCDAWLGPVNSFRTAQRNFAAAVQPGAGDLG